MHMAQIVCYAFIDKQGERILLGDLRGRLFMLVLHTKQGERYPEVDDIKVRLDKDHKNNLNIYRFNILAKLLFQSAWCI